MCFQMAIRATIFNQEKKQTTTFCLSTSLTDIFGAVLIVLKKRIYRVCTSTMFCFHQKGTEKADGTTLHIYILLGFFLFFKNFFFVFLFFSGYTLDIILKKNRDKII